MNESIQECDFPENVPECSGYTASPDPLGINII